MTTPQIEVTHALMSQWIGRYVDVYPIHEDLQNALKQAAQWGYDQGLAATATEDQLQEARDQQLDECCKWLEQKSGTVWAGELRRDCRPKVDDSEAADAARMRWLLKGHGYPTYLAIREVTAWLEENDSKWNVGGDAAVDAARREIDKRMARTIEFLQGETRHQPGVVRQTEADE